MANGTATQELIARRHHTLAAQTFLWGDFRQGSARISGDCLIHMGDRHDSVVARSEETGSSGTTGQVCKMKIPLSKNSKEVWFRPRHEGRLTSGPPIDIQKNHQEYAPQLLLVIHKFWA